MITVSEGLARPVNKKTPLTNRIKSISSVFGKAKSRFGWSVSLARESPNPPTVSPGELLQAHLLPSSLGRNYIDMSTTREASGQKATIGLADS